MAGNDVSISVQVRDQTSAAFAAVGAAVKGLAANALIPAAAAAAAYGAQLAAAGVAVGIFGAAVAPQAQAVTGAAEAQDKYTEAVRKYGKDSKQALQAQEDFKSQMAEMPAATQDTARAFISLKGAYGQWSDSLAGDTMPIFTTAMKTIQGILPKLSPLVKDVAAQFQTLVDRFAAFAKTEKFDQMVTKFSAFASGSLKNIISGMETLARTVAGWVTSEGFQEFIAMGSAEGPGMVEMLKNLAEAVGKFIVAAGPMAGLSLKVLEILATALNAIPLDVLQVLVPVIMGLVLAARLYTVAITAWTVAQMLWNAVMLVNPVVLIIAGILALIAVVVLIATKTTWFQTIWKYAWGAIKAVMAGAWEGIKWIWEQLKAGASAVIDKVKEIIAWVKNIVGKTIKLAQQGASVVVEKAREIINKVKQVVGKTIRLAQVGASIVIGKAMEIVNWVKRVVGKTIRLAQTGASTVVGWIGDIISRVRNMVGKTISVGVRGASAAVQAVQNVINKIRNFVGKTVSIGVNFFKGAGSKIASALGFAHGGITGAAGGGPRSNTTLVGEYGPELVDLAPGSRVRSNADSRRIAAGSGSGGMAPFVIQLNVGPTTLGEIIVDPLRKAVHSRGGNVQAVLGRA